jgi:hypothetical protein
MLGYKAMPLIFYFILKENNMLGYETTYVTSVTYYTEERTFCYGMKLCNQCYILYSSRE